MQNKVKPTDLFKTLRKLIRFMGKRAWLLLLTISIAGLWAFFQSRMPRMMGNITNIIFDGVKQGMTDGQFPIDFEAVLHASLVLAGTYALMSVSRYFMHYATTQVAQNTVYKLRYEVKAKMSRLPIEFFDQNSKGDILSRTINDIDQVSNALGQSINQISMSLAQLTAVSISMLTLSGPLALIVVAMAPVILIIIAVIAPRAQRQFGKRQRDLGRVNDYAEERYAGQEIVRVYHQEAHEIAAFEEHSQRLNESSWRAEFYSGLMNPLVLTAKDTAYITVAFVGGMRIIAGLETIGTVQAFLQYVNMFSNPFHMLAQLANTIQMTVASLDRVFEILDHPEVANPEGRDDEVTDAIVKFDHVRFGYLPDKVILKDFSLEVEPGSMVAIVGPTGAGKSTLINLLERYYDVNDGAIYFQGTDIRNLSRNKLREHFSIVPQDPWLFNGTIWDNIRYGSEGRSDEEILQAAKSAHVDDFVQTLPDGYQTVLSEEATNISNGQRQLITIARAFLRDPDVIILDEATSSVDTRTEVMIQHAMRNILEGRTSFVIAHRLSTIRDADTIIVMDQGDVVEHGNHDELMAQGGFYANLYQAQFQ